MIQLARRVLLIILAVSASAMTVGNPATAGERKAVSYTSRIGPVVSRSVAPTGIKPGHELAQVVRQDMTISNDPDWNEAAVLNYGHTDMAGGAGTVSGYAVRTHKSGDKSFVSFRGTLRTVEDGGKKDLVGEGTVELTGGTGKFANARGSGTWTSARGESHIKMDVEY